MDVPTLEYPFLQEVYTPPQQAKINFVFVHGLNPRGRTDHPFETWTHPNGTFWPTAFLAEDVPFARIFIYGYNCNVAEPQVMSTASIKDHANTLLNLLALERGDGQTTPSKIIFIGHSLGGLVIKQALLNAHEDPKYTSIRQATFGLVFFGCPHRGSKGVELGQIAAQVARFVAQGHASNDLLDCLEHNSLFTRNMSDRFRHQLEDYRVVSFVEGKGPLIVDEESAVLGLSGLRETQLKLDADHSNMCKVSHRGPMYKLIKGNVKLLVDQALVTLQGWVPQQPTVNPTSPPPPPPLPPRLHSNSSTPYQPAPTPQQPATANAVVGALYTPVDSDPRSAQAAQLKNKARWDEARTLEHQVFQDHLRTLGPEHCRTIAAGYQLAEIDLENGYLDNAAEWAQWVSSSSARALGAKHPLAMKAESLRGEILCHQGRSQDAESVCANVLARQQMAIGEDHLDTLETRRRLSFAYSCLGRRDHAVVASQKRTAALTALLGENHVKVLASLLDTVAFTISTAAADESAALSMRFQPDVQHLAGETMPLIHRKLHQLLGPDHVLAIRALRLHASVTLLAANNPTEASEMFRRALALAEDHLGPENPETMAIVADIGMLYATQNNPYSGLSLSLPFLGGGSASGSLAEASPWLLRYLDWTERRKGKENPEAQRALELLGTMHMRANEYADAQRYFERLMATFHGKSHPASERVGSLLQICRMNTMFSTPGVDGLLQSFRRFY